MPEKIDHPEHYNAGPIEVIDAADAWRLDLYGFNVVKYIARAGLKPGSTELDDWRKAAWYCARKIAKLEAVATAGPSLAPAPAGPSPAVAESAKPEPVVDEATRFKRGDAVRIANSYSLAKERGRILVYKRFASGEQYPHRTVDDDKKDWWFKPNEIEAVRA